MTKGGYVYLLASGRNGTLYIGVTSKLDQRILQHQNWSNKSFTGKYQVNRLVWYEWHDYMEEAIAREKQLKKWNRIWKIALIEKDNPNWDDLSLSLQAQ
jgi:putative endonuclease